MRKLIYISILSLTAGFAQADQPVTVPELEGGFTASIGTFYATPSSSNNSFTQHQGPSGDVQSNHNNSQYQFGTQGSVGYIFDNSANGVEVSGRGFNH